MSNTATILRVKRKIEENPQDALLLVCKRAKTNSEEISPSLFVFRGTVDNQETTNVSNIVPKTEVKLKIQHDVSDIIEKMRKARKKASEDSRYEIVNCSRNLKDIGDNSNEVFDLLDLQKANNEDKDVQYAYDLYFPVKKEEFDSSILDNLLSIEVLGSNWDDGQKSASEDEADDDDDSNDENNWRNDYPDTEESSIDEEDIIRAMKNCDLDNDLSSDADEDKIYDDRNMSEDANLYGPAYAKYKIKVLQEVEHNSEDPPKNLIYCSRVKDIDEESVEGYKDDSNGFYYGEDEDTEQFREQYGDLDIPSDEYSPD